MFADQLGSPGAAGCCTITSGAIEGAVLVAFTFATGRGVVLVAYQKKLRLI